LQDLYAPDPDPYLVKESFERTDEQNEELGLNDIRTENYS
jgi:zinc finger protein